MTNAEFTHSLVAQIAADGLKVYMRKPTDEYCYVTDGKGIAYAQWSNSRTCISTVHMANKTTGTGFQFADTITPHFLREAMALIAPNWADARERASVRKYADWNQFHNESDWNKGFTEVTA